MSLPQRMWVNQPSIHQPHHHLHGERVMAVHEYNDTWRVYFLRGDKESMQMSSLSLSKGWPKGGEVTWQDEDRADGSSAYDRACDERAYGDPYQDRTHYPPTGGPMRILTRDGDVLEVEVLERNEEDALQPLKLRFPKGHRLHDENDGIWATKDYYSILRNFLLTITDTDGVEHEYKFIALTPWAVFAHAHAAITEHRDFYGHELLTTMNVKCEELLSTTDMKGAITSLR